MNLIQNLLHSGYSFTKEENLEKFRFSLFNSIATISTFFTLLNFLAGKFHFIFLNDRYEFGLLLYASINICSIFLLRLNKSFYRAVGYITIISATALFYLALFETMHNEFRLVWFHLVNFVAFILLGKRFGIYLTLVILVSVFFINLNVDLALTKIAMFSFYNSFFVLAIIAYFFLQKIENDALEFKVLNNKLKDKVSFEVHQREKQEKILLQQCRMASMGEMIDSIAHQWRQPLMNINAILLNMDRVIEEEVKNDNITVSPQHYLEEKMDDVVMLTSHMSQTIEDFRSLFNDNKEKTKFKLIEPLEYVIELLKNYLKEVNIEIEQHYVLEYYGYQNELTQVLLIFFNNAIEALKQSDKDEKQLTIKIEKIPHYFSMSIEDNGKGIEEENINKIFDPYFTTKKAIGGTGIGLYIAKIIIEQNMKGVLSVVNTSKGAKFTILLGEDNVKNT